MTERQTRSLVCDGRGYFRCERFIGMRMLIVVASAAFGASLASFGKWILVKAGLAG